MCSIQAGTKVALMFKTKKKQQSGNISHFILKSHDLVCVHQTTHATSRSVALVCCSRLCMNLHWPSVKGRPVRLMLSSINWASSNSHCTTNMGPAGQTRSACKTQRFHLPGPMRYATSYFLMRGRFLARRNTSTPLQDAPVCTSLAERCASTCTRARCHTPAS